MNYSALDVKFRVKITEQANNFSQFIAFSIFGALTLQWASLTQPAPGESPRAGTQQG